MEIVGRTTIHPLVFYSGKLSGYLTWVLLGLDCLGVRAVQGLHAVVLDYLSYILLVVEMNAFLRGHRVLAVKKEFVPDGEGSFHDPKERTICAAPFRERVMHHALMNVCEPVLKRAAVFDSYACRKGKGQLASACASSIWGGGQRARIPRCA